MKRTLCAILSLAVLSAQAVFAAENYAVTISGTARPGYTLKAEYELAEGEKIIWYADGEQVGEGAKYTLKNSDAGKMVRAEAADASSDAVKVAAALTACSVKNGNKIADYNSELKAEDNPEYLFTENGYTYAMLAEEEKGVYVIVQEAAGRVKLDASPENNYFNPDDSTTIAYWLNNQYLDGEYGTGGKPVNEHVINYLQEREYLTEGNGESGAPNENDYVVKCKVALPAFYELVEEYPDIIGYNPLGLQYYTIFRSPVNHNKASCPNLKVDTGVIGITDVTIENKNYMNLTLRPCMLISYDFFRKYKLDDAGDKVKEMLRRNFAKAELRAAEYTEDELASIGYSSEAPELGDFHITGIRAAGQMLAFESMAAIPENVSTDHKWYVLEENGIEKLVGEDAYYIIDEKYAGERIKAEVTLFDSVTSEKYGMFSSVTEEIGAQKKLTVIPTANKNKADFKVINSTEENITVYLIISAFDGNNAMTDFVAEEITAVPGESSHSLMLETEAEMYRVMAWNSAELSQMLCGITVR